MITSDESTTKQAPAFPSSQEQTANLAYFIWLSEGCPQGRDCEHWLQAEAQLATQTNSTPTPPSAA